VKHTPYRCRPTNDEKQYATDIVKLVQAGQGREAERRIAARLARYRSEARYQADINGTVQGSAGYLNGLYLAAAIVHDHVPESDPTHAKLIQEIKATRQREIERHANWKAKEGIR
jgi:hypothetical protein